jgi:hypothetical protein
VLLLLTAASTPASAYQVRKSTSGSPLRWPQGAIPVELALDGAPEGVDADAAAVAAERAFETFSQALTPMEAGVDLDVQRSRGGSRVSTGDHLATVTWVAEGWDDDYDPEALAVTVTSYDPANGRIQDADIVINRDHRWNAGEGCESAYDLEGVLAHEVGHLFGLGHEPGDQEATMFPSAGVCEVKKRDLAETDLEGLRFLYLESAPPPPLACNAVPGGRGGAGAVLLVLGVLGFALRRRAVIVAATLLLVVTPAQATTVRSLGLEAAGKTAAVVARGTVRSVEVRRVGDRVYTDAQLGVLECVKGRCGASLVIRQLGGELDGEGVVVAGNADLVAGSEVVVMLRARRDGTFAPVGMAQGVFRVERDAAGTPRALVRDTRDLVLVGDGGEVRSGVERLRYEELRKVGLN